MADAKPSFGEWASGPHDCRPEYAHLWERARVIAPLMEGGGRTSRMFIRGSGEVPFVPWFNTTPSAGGVAWDYSYGSSIGTNGGAYWATNGPVSPVPLDEFTAVVVTKTAAASNPISIVSCNSSQGNNGWRLNHSSAHALRFTLGGVADYSFGQTLSTSTWYVFGFAFSASAGDAYVAFRKLHDHAMILDSLTTGTMTGSANDLAFGQLKGDAVAAPAMFVSIFGLFDGYDEKLAIDLCGDPYSWAKRGASTAALVPAGGGGVTVPALDEGMLMGGFMPLGGGFD